MSNNKNSFDRKGFKAFIEHPYQVWNDKKPHLTSEKSSSCDFSQLKPIVEEDRSIKELTERVDALEKLIKHIKTQAGNKVLLDALQLIYQKHVGNDDSIGWEELTNVMTDALAQTMGDDAFCEWLESTHEQ